MKTDKINLGDTIVMFNGKCHYRVVQITTKYFLLDDPEGRCYDTRGSLMYMPFKKLFFDTRNPVWNPNSIESVDNSYNFKLQEFTQSTVYVDPKDIEKNYLPTISESLKLKRPYDL